MTYIAPIALSREAQLVKRRCGAAFVGPGGYRRRVERLRAVEHCSKVLLARMFNTLPDAFRYFLAIGDGPSFFLSDFQLESCFITVQQLEKGLYQLLVQAVPHPAPLSLSRRIASKETPLLRSGLHGKQNAVSSASSWSIDIEDIVEEVTVGFRSQLSLLDFLRMFEWDHGQGAETQLQIAANRRHLEYQVRMEIREKSIVGKWKFLSMTIRARVIYWRWMYLMATFAWKDWRAFTKASLEMKRKEGLAAAHARETLLRRIVDFWHARLLQCRGDRAQVCYFQSHSSLQRESHVLCMAPMATPSCHGAWLVHFCLSVFYLIYEAILWLVGQLASKSLVVYQSVSRLAQSGARGAEAWPRSPARMYRRA